MLQRLCINNVALIENLDVEFGEGLNVLTGETGAGKSIIIDAVNLALGERASRELIMHDAAKAKVEALFTDVSSPALQAALEENGLETDADELILSREVSSTGKNVCRINGSLVTMAVLKKISDHLVDIHGQHEHQALLDPQTHIRYLDVCGGDAALEKAKKLTAKTASAYHALLAENKNATMPEDERARQIDLFTYQLHEIDSAMLSEDEEENLLKERAILVNAGKIMEALDESYELFHSEQGALQQLEQAKRALESISAYDEAYENIGKRMADAYYTVEDIGYALRDAKSGFEFDASRLSEIEIRLDTIAGLKRKYGAGISDILAYRDGIEEKLHSLVNAAQDQAELQKKMDECVKAYQKAAEDLGTLRKKAAERLRAQMLEQLRDVGMSKADFQVEFRKSDRPRFSQDGEDEIEFLLSANPGEPCKPLSKVASGGELSRIMLAFKTILADRDAVPTLIFDEIDTGISGKMASIVGGKMVMIAGAHQVLCITHLPQIAALADLHYLIQKQDDGKTTRSHVIQLDEDGCVSRLSAMMSGEADSALGREHARELLEKSRKEKMRLRKDKHV